MYMSPYGVRPSQYSSVAPIESRSAIDLIKFNGAEASKECVLKSCHADIVRFNAIKHKEKHGTSVSNILWRYNKLWRNPRHN